MTPGGLLLLAAAGLCLGGVTGFRAARWWLSFSLVGAGAAIAAGVSVLASGQAWEWHPDLVLGGERVHLRLDGVSAFFLVLESLLGGAGTLYASAYWSDRRHPRSAPTGRAWWNALLVSMALVLLVVNGVHFLIAWELFAVCAYFLITIERHRREVRAAGWLYLVASHAGTLCLFAFFSMLAARTGGWELGPVRERADLAPLFWLALAGFGIKAGVFPLHIWLPSAHANAPSHVSAILSGVAIKMGIYGMVRFSGWLPLPDGAGWVVAGLGVTSAVLGVAFALGQHDLKRLLAYHSVENIGIILIGLGFAMVAADRGAPRWGGLVLAGALLHVWNHGLFKALLFLGSGAVLHATGTREMSRLGGLWRVMPWTASLFVLGSAAIAGLPPLNGFVSEWLVYVGLFEATTSGAGALWGAIPALVLLGVTGAMALACFVKVVGVVFLGEARSEAARRAHECAWPMRVPMICLGLACVVIGLLPGLCWPALSAAAISWRSIDMPALPPAPLLNLGACNLALVLAGTAGALLLGWRIRRNGFSRAPTWDCGYAAPTPRMQYTAGSFAGIITEWFAWMLRPERHAVAPRGLFPPRAHDTTHTPETVLERVVEPVGAVVMRLSLAVRRLQHGRLQAYILYLLVGLVAVALLAWGGGTP